LLFSDWRDLSVEQEKYLVQIRPPGDTILASIRTLVMTQNVTSAGILYDQNFGNLFSNEMILSYVRFHYDCLL
jgi:hypothetical protein